MALLLVIISEITTSKDSIENPMIFKKLLYSINWFYYCNQFAAVIYTNIKLYLRTIDRFSKFKNSSNRHIKKP